MRVRLLQRVSIRLGSQDFCTTSMPRPGPSRLQTTHIMVESNFSHASEIYFECLLLTSIYGKFVVKAKVGEALADRPNRRSEFKAK